MKGIERVVTVFRKFTLSAEGVTSSPSRGVDDEPQIDHIAMAILVEEAIADDPELCSAQINVEAFGNVVQLSGFVDAPAHMNKAVCVAGEVKGVESVRNCMQLAWW